jgi:dihydroorotase
MKPPLRSETDRRAMIEGLIDGTIDAIASDHAPHHADEKDVEYNCAPFGILGLETTLPLCLERLVHAGLIPLSRFIELLTIGPARALNLPVGSLAPGKPGDVTIFDPDRQVTIDPEAFRSKGRNTPFGGWKLRGAAIATVVGGRRVVV